MNTLFYFYLAIPLAFYAFFICFCFSIFYIIYILRRYLVHANDIPNAPSARLPFFNFILCGLILYLILSPDLFTSPVRFFVILAISFAHSVLIEQVDKAGVLAVNHYGNSKIKRPSKLLGHSTVILSGIIFLGRDLSVIVSNLSVIVAIQAVSALLLFICFFLYAFNINASSASLLLVKRLAQEKEKPLSKETPETIPFLAKIVIFLACLMFLSLVIFGMFHLPKPHTTWFKKTTPRPIPSYDRNKLDKQTNPTEPQQMQLPKGKAVNGLHIPQIYDWSDIRDRNVSHTEFTPLKTFNDGLVLYKKRNPEDISMREQTTELTYFSLPLHLTEASSFYGKKLDTNNTLNNMLERETVSLGYLVHEESNTAIQVDINQLRFLNKRIEGRAIIVEQLSINNQYVMRIYQLSRFGLRFVFEHVFPPYSRFIFDDLITSIPTAYSDHTESTPLLKYQKNHYSQPSFHPTSLKFALPTVSIEIKKSQTPQKINDVKFINMAAHNHKKLAQEITALHQFISDTQFRHYQLRSVSKLDHPDWFEFKFSHNEPKCDTGITYYYNYKENAVIHTFGLDFHFSPDSQYIFMGGCNEMYSEPTYLLNLNIAQNMLSKEASFDWGCFESIKWDGPNVLVQLAYPSRIWQKKRYIIQKDADEWVVLDNEPINQHLEN